MKTRNPTSRRVNKAEIKKMIASNFQMPVAKPNYVDYLGTVNYATSERVLTVIRQISETKPGEDIWMTVTSPGGPTGTAMCFYDHIKSILKPNLITIGSGDVDSSGFLIFLSGHRRYVTKHTTGLLHLAGRTFPEGNRFTAPEIEAMMKEDRLKDEQYASVVAENSHNKLTPQKVLELMKNNTVLTAESFVELGLAEAIL